MEQQSGVRPMDVVLGAHQIDVRRELGPRERIEFVQRFLNKAEPQLELMVAHGFRTLEEIMKRPNQGFNERVLDRHDNHAGLPPHLPCELAIQFASAEEGEMVAGPGVPDMRAQMRCSDLFLSARGQLIVWDQHYRRSFARHSSYDAGVKRIETSTHSRLWIPSDGALLEIMSSKVLEAVIVLVQGVAEAAVQSHRRQADASAEFLHFVKSIKEHLHFPQNI